MPGFGHRWAMAITEQAFEVPAESLFETLVNPATYPQWLIGTRHIRSVSEHWPEPASYFKHTVGIGPIAIADRTTLSFIDRPHTLELVVRARPVLEAVVRFDVSTSPSGCVLRMEEQPIGVFKLLAGVAQRLIATRNQLSMERLKSMMETEATGLTDIASPSDPRGQES
jgi:hypothetical protein